MDMLTNGYVVAILHDRKPFWIDMACNGAIDTWMTTAPRGNDKIFEPCVDDADELLTMFVLLFINVVDADTDYVGI